MYIKSYFRAYNVPSLIHKLWVIYILNLTDIVFTLLLVSTGAFVEANPAMQNMVHTNPAMSIIAKTLIPLALILYITQRIQFANDKQLKQSNILINGLTILYVIINISHVCYTLLFIGLLLFI